MRLSSVIRGVALGVVAAGVAAPLLRRRLRLPAPATAAVAFCAPIGIAVAFPRTRTRDVAVCFAQMWAYICLYEMPNDDPEELERRVKVRYPVRVDRVIGFGQLPGVRLQRALSRADQLGRLDATLTWSHWLWFLIPNGTVAWFLTFRHDDFPRAAVMTYAVFNTGALAYWAVPTAPPWYAAQHGAIVADPALRRLMVEHGQRFWKDRWEPLYAFFGGNPLAAMPSLHFATSVNAALLLSDAGPITGAIGWAYATTLGFALVYLGEHYVIDLVAGAALTMTVRRLAKPVGPVVEGAGRAIGALNARATG